MSDSDSSYGEYAEDETFEQMMDRMEQRDTSDEEGSDKPTLRNRVRASSDQAIVQLCAAEKCGVLVLLLGDGTVTTHDVDASRGRAPRCASRSAAFRKTAIANSNESPPSIRPGLVWPSVSVFCSVSARLRRRGVVHRISPLDYC